MKSKLNGRNIRKNNVKEQISFSFDCCPTMKTLLEGIKMKKKKAQQNLLLDSMICGSSTNKPLHYYFPQSGFLR